MKPAAYQQTFLAILVIAVVATVIAMAAFSAIPFLRAAENWVYDLRAATLTPPQPAHPEIVVVAITEDTLAGLAYRSPIDRSFLAEIVTAIDAAGPRAIGLDILFDQPTEPAKDAELQTALANLSAPVVLAWADGEDGLTQRQTAYLREFVASQAKGYVNLLKDGADGVVRYLFPGKNTLEGAVPGFSGAIAKELGVVGPTSAVELVFRPPTAEGGPPFRMFPAHVVKHLPKAWFKDKIVLIGADLPHGDRHRTPLAAGPGDRGMLSGVFIHAHILAQLLDKPAPTKVGYLWQAGIAILVAAIGCFLVVVDVGNWLKTGAGTVALAAFWVGGFALYAEGAILLPLVAPSAAGILSIGAAGAYLGRRERERKKFIRNAFSRFTSPQVVEQLLDDPERLKVNGERREVTCLFTDLAGFTAMIEKEEPSVILPKLNLYLDGMCRIAFDHGGTIDKIVGDALHVMFNAPVDQFDHPARAVACALEMDSFARDFVEVQRHEGYEFGATRIGVNTGELVVGNFGGEVFFDYTAHGDAINTAARLESVNKHLGTLICVSAATADRCGDGFRFRPVGALVLKGKQIEIDVHEPIYPALDETIDLDAYDAAFGEMAAGKQNAANSFEALSQKYPDDKLTALHARRLAAGEMGVTIVMKEK
jgi:adenylate cyclase